MEILAELPVQVGVIGEPHHRPALGHVGLDKREDEADPLARPDHLPAEPGPRRCPAKRRAPRHERAEQRDLASALRRHKSALALHELELDSDILDRPSRFVEDDDQGLNFLLLHVVVGETNVPACSRSRSRCASCSSRRWSSIRPSRAALCLTSRPNCSRCRFSSIAATVKPPTTAPRLVRLRMSSQVPGRPGACHAGRAH